MKKIPKLAAHAVTLGCVFFATGCNDLEEVSYSLPTPDNFFGSTGDVAAAIQGMYPPLQVSPGNSGPYLQNRGWMLNAPSDEGDTNDFGFGWGNLDLLKYTPGSQDVTREVYEYWKATYQSIASANFVLDNEAKIKALYQNAGVLKPNTPATAAHALAEARFMRAVNYFDLVRAFGPVPLRLTVPKRLDEVNIPRSPEEQVYVQIIQDLAFAEANLPTKPDRIGQPVQAAASAYLAKVYLTRKEFPKALEYANKVVGTGTYQLLPKFADVFAVDNENNQEVILDIQFTRLPGVGNRFPHIWTAGTDATPNGGWGLAYMEQSMYAKYPATDDRTATTFLNAKPNEPTYFVGKWKDPRGLAADGHENNFILFRYADLLLIQAEAANEVAGPTAAAFAPLNAVRARAKLPALTGLSQAAFREAVLQERHLELCYEQHRWFDLKRTGKLREAVEKLGKKDIVWNDRVLLFPIPDPEIRASNGVLTQNPGY